MATTKLSDRTCVPCTARTKPLPNERAVALLPRVPGWTLARNGRLRRTVRFEDFISLIEFVNELADLAEEQAHHPDFKVHWTRLDIELFTHAIRGLTENDFILAAKIDDLLGERA